MFSISLFAIWNKKQKRFTYNPKCSHGFKIPRLYLTEKGALKASEGNEDLEIRRLVLKENAFQ